MCIKNYKKGSVSEPSNSVNEGNHLELAKRMNER